MWSFGLCYCYFRGLWLDSVRGEDFFFGCVVVGGWGYVVGSICGVRGQVVWDYLGQVGVIQVCDS